MCITQLEQIAFDFNRHNSRMSALPIIFLLALSSRPGEWISSKTLQEITGSTKEIRSHIFHWFEENALIESKKERNSNRLTNLYRAINIRPINPFDEPMMKNIYCRSSNAILKYPSRGALLLIIYIAIHHRNMNLQTEISSYVYYSHGQVIDKVIRELVTCGELVMIGIGGNDTTPRNNTIYDVR